MELFNYSLCMITIVFYTITLVQSLPENSMNTAKRHLKWNDKGYIVSKEGSEYEIKYLMPNSDSVAVESDGNYLAFTLYMRNGRWEVPNTGIFHFIDSETAWEKRFNCGRKTMHEGAYYHFYGKCPESETNLVASGYCYQGSLGKDLVYNSITFNNPSMTYLDGRYYLNNDRTVHPYEQNLIKVCFNNWKDSGFQVNSWNCSTGKVPTASGLTSDFGKRAKRASLACNTCECTPLNRSSGRKTVNVQTPPDGSSRRKTANVQTPSNGSSRRNAVDVLIIVVTLVGVQKNMHLM